MYIPGPKEKEQNEDEERAENMISEGGPVAPEPEEQDSQSKPPQTKPKKDAR